jgi:hypothetical protein
MTNRQGTTAWINPLTDIPEHLHTPGPTADREGNHWASAGHYVPGQKNVRDDGHTHRTAVVESPLWSQGLTAAQMQLYVDAVAGRIVWRRPSKSELDELGRTLEQYDNGSFDYPIRGGDPSVIEAWHARRRRPRDSRWR